jgi:hypothetical protein
MNKAPKPSLRHEKSAVHNDNQGDQIGRNFAYWEIVF